MQKAIDINGYQNLETALNDEIRFDKKLIVEASYEKDILFLTYSDEAITKSKKSFVKVFSKKHEVTRVVRKNGKKKAVKVTRGYESIDEAKCCGIDKKQHTNLTNAGIKIVSEIEIPTCWIIIYTSK